MPLILPGNVASATAATGFNVDNSCRFNGDDDSYMHKTLGTPTSTKICTISWWMKQHALMGGGDGPIFSAKTDTNNRHVVYWDNSGGLMKIWGKTGGSVNFTLSTTQVFRDPSAWQHHVIAIDTNQSTDTNRVKWYMNGTQITSFSETTYPGEDALLEFSKDSSVAYVAAYATSGGVDVFGGANFLAEFVFIDGQQLTPTSFGEFDEDSPTIWKPKDVSELTFGNNGFYLDFEDSANLGNDANGGTDLTEVNLAAADQATDTPTNNFCVMNPLDNYNNAATFSEGNCKLVTASSPYYYNTGTFGLSNGKWYYECKVASSAPSDYNLIGIAGDTAEGSELGGTGTYGYGYHGNDGKYITDVITGGGAAYAYGDTYSTSTIGVYIDLDNDKLYFAKDGAIQNSGTGISIGTSPPHGVFYPAGGEQSTSGSATLEFNFGGCSAFDVASGNTDGTYGNFEYSPNDDGGSSFDGAAKNFLAICTKNLAEYG